MTTKEAEYEQARQAWLDRHSEVLRVPTDRDRRNALYHECPDCGAKPGVRCRILTPNSTNPRRTNVDVRRKPCDVRTTLAMRQEALNAI